MQRHMPLGYKMIDGKIAIEKEKAEAVRRIFDDFISGKSMYKMAQEFTQNGLLNANGKSSWNHGSIGKILQNCKYIGDEYYPTIITEEAFNMAKSLRDGKVKQLNHSNNYFANNLTSTYHFSGRIICGECGTTFKRYMEHHDKNKKSNWKCKRYIVDNRVCCRSAVIDDKQLEQAFITVINKVIEDPALIYRLPQNRVMTANFSTKKLEMEIAHQSSQKPADPAEMAKLLFQRAAEGYKASTVDDFKYQTNKLKKLLEGLSPIDCFEGDFFKMVIKQVTIYTNETLRFEFTNGAEIDTSYKLRRKRRD